MATMERPVWLDGLFDEGEPTFFRTTSGRRVHVAVRLRESMVPFHYWFVGACGAELLRAEGGSITEFPDADLCGRCHRAAGDWSDELFDHPQGED